MGVFVFGSVHKNARALDAYVGFGFSVAVNAFFFGMEKYVTGEVWVAWRWYPLLGILVSFAVGGLMSVRHSQRAETVETRSESERTH